MKIFVISLRESSRRQKIAAQLAKLNLPFRFFDAIKPTEATYQDKEYAKFFRKIFFGYDLSLGEIGCYKSHQSIWRFVVVLGKPVLVLEDDIILSGELSDFIKKVEENIDRYDFGILRLSGIFVQPRYLIECHDLTFVRYFNHPRGTQGYIIKPDAARKLLDYTKIIRFPVDVAIDREYCHKIKFYGMEPYLIYHDTHGCASEIGARSGVKKSLRLKILKELLNGFFSLKRIIYTSKEYLINRFILRRYTQRKQASSLEFQQ